MIHSILKFNTYYKYECKALYNIYKAPRGKPLNLNYVFKRTMLTRTTTAMGIKNISSRDTSYVNRSALAFNKFVTDPQTIHEIGCSFNKNIATPTLTKFTNEFISNDDGLKTMKTNFLSAFTDKKGYQLQHSFSSLSSQNLNPKVSYHNMLQNKTTISRNLIEYNMIDSFANRLTEVSTVVILGDHIPGLINKALTPDFRVTFNSGVVKDFDAKNGRMQNQDVFSGYLHEITIGAGKSIVGYPRDFTNYQTQYEEISLGIESRLPMFSKSMSPYDFAILSDKFRAYKQGILSSDFSLNHDNTVLEGYLCSINQLKSYPLNLNSYNIYHLQDAPLSNSEMLYLQKMVQYLNPNLLDNPIFMRTFLINSLHEYRNIIDPNICKKLLPIRDYFPFITEFLTYHGY